jgi:heme-degrading monooxygenase HmoA
MNGTDVQPPHAYRIDRFVLPASARDEFLARVRQTRELLQAQPGFVRDYLLEQPAGADRVNIITFVEWDSVDRVEHVKAAVQAMHREAGFDPRDMFERLGVGAEMGMYRPVDG